MPPLDNNTQTTTPMFDENVVPILLSQEKEIKSKIPSVLGIKTPSPAKDMQDYVKTKDPTLKEKAKDSLLKLQSIAGKVPEYLSLFGGGKVDPVAKPEVPTFFIRSNAVSHNDLEEAKAILFGEISNRSPEKQRLEAQTILNTAFNRMDEYAKRGTPKTLTEVLQMPNQYQAYGGKQYKLFKSGGTGELDKGKIEAIDSILGQVKNGDFQNNVGGSVFYKHTKDGRIIPDDRQLFK